MELQVEMLIAYDIKLFEKNFYNNEERLTTFLSKYFKETYGHKVAGLQVEENVLFAWSYYFVNLADDDIKAVDHIMGNMFTHFDYMLNSDEESQASNGDKSSNHLLLDHTFCATWFKTSVCVMLMMLYGKDRFRRADEYLEENYYSKNQRFRSLMLQEPPKQDENN
ncbi:hypothetical protein [Inconstantimicrobium mannanitabidum]|uniref:Uncharacterized protein n=1 Tax=Inconstantimicrobium mannanitabidum TaxID=1604901 RepID=A0ACB5RH18_9CLOT|nr:hypothetical protein [Clostridium sp. TW13]GKX68372.1 hypothetical protein rsdtw13_36300 [Clostridium sp. TW13]